jgi:hypothetical protein
MATAERSFVPAGTEATGSRKKCDIVMKGGITSGVVYPAAVLELKRDYEFVNVGGASAGAIAAVVTAAAEYRRQTDGSDEGFVVLKEVMTQLTEDGFVQGLFQPTPPTRPLYELLIASLKVVLPPKAPEAGAEPKAQEKTGGTMKKVLRKVVPVLRVLWRQQRRSRIAWAVVGALAWALVLLAGWGLGLVAAPEAWGWPAILGAVVGLLIAIVLGSVVGFVLGTVRTFRGVYAALDGNGFGMCPGRSQPGFEGREALTDWLHGRIQACAGPSLRQPLTLRDLTDKGVNLETVTTDLTLARPVRVPFEFERYQFRPRDLRRVFPDDVVDHMKKTSPSIPAGVDPAEVDEEGLLDMPVAQDMPVVTFARLSLSFPVLLTGVRLYSADPSQPDREPMAHWLSDGGIGSNFPIHFFDGWLPGRPTFGLNLGPYPSAGRVEPGGTGGDVERWATGDIWLPTSPDQSRFRRRTSVTSLPKFLAQILDTMQNWRDTSQAELPGFWDRVCEIRLLDDEGGLNLTMPVPTIARLMAKGKEAGSSLRDRFNWEQHQFTRYRMLMATLQRRLRGDDAHSGVVSRYESFGPLLRSGIPGATHYRDGIEDAWFSRADDGTVALLDRVRGWDLDSWGEPKGKIDFTIQGDLPTWVMRITPKV